MFPADKKPRFELYADLLIQACLSCEHRKTRKKGH
jgi:hypothetical protein